VPANFEPWTEFDDGKNLRDSKVGQMKGLIFYRNQIMSEGQDSRWDRMPPVFIMATTGANFFSFSYDYFKENEFETQRGDVRENGSFRAKKKIGVRGSRDQQSKDRHAFARLRDDTNRQIMVSSTNSNPNPNVNDKKWSPKTSKRQTKNNLFDDSEDREEFDQDMNFNLTQKGPTYNPSPQNVQNQNTSAPINRNLDATMADNHSQSTLDAPAEENNTRETGFFAFSSGQQADGIPGYQTSQNDENKNFGNPFDDTGNRRSAREDTAPSFGMGDRPIGSGDE
jgi:hypothetical protein